MSVELRLARLWRARGLAARLLWPLSVAFGVLVWVRRALFRVRVMRARHPGVPVVVVGNITVGGSGKTPLVLYLAHELTRRGRRPLIVSRGYGARYSHPRPVRAFDTADDAGDEPLLMQRRGPCPVWVGHDRAAVALAGLNAHPECDLILCDDGLQHYRLARDVEIAVLDARGLMNGWLLPAGPLREPASRLKRVDAVVGNGCAPPAPAGRGFCMTLHTTTFYRLDAPALICDAASLRGKRLHAVAGIGAPERFFDTLGAMGLSVSAHAFADHHRYDVEDLCFSECDAILMTEKDAVKCVSLTACPVWVLPVDAQLAPDLAEFVLSCLTRKDENGPATA